MRFVDGLDRLVYCDHSQSIITVESLGVTALVLGTSMLVLSTSDGDLSWMHAVFVAGMCALAVLTLDSMKNPEWRRSTISLKDANKLAEMLRLAEKYSIDLPLLPAATSETMTNGMLEAWCLKAKKVMKGKGIQIEDGCVEFPERYVAKE